MRNLGLAVLVLVAPFTARALAPLADSATGTAFKERPVVDGVAFDCIGTGHKKLLLRDAYALAFCVDASKFDPVVREYVAQAHPGKEGDALAAALETDGEFYRRLALGPADRLVVMRTLRNVSRDQLGKLFRDALGHDLPADKLQALISNIPSDAPKGSLVRIASKGDRLILDISGTATALDDPEIARGVFRMFIGPHTVTPTLRIGIAERVSERAAEW